MKHAKSQVTGQGTRIEHQENETLRFDICTCEREFFIDNLLARIHFIIVMIRWTGRAPWEFEFPFPGSLTSTFLGSCDLAWFSHSRLDKGVL